MSSYFQRTRFVCALTWDCLLIYRRFQPGVCMDPMRKKGRRSPFSDVTNVPSKGMGYRAYSLFTCDTPVVFNFIGYLILL